MQLNSANNASQGHNYGANGSSSNGKSLYKDTTKSKVSIKNRQTDVGKKEFSKNLESSGYSKDIKGGNNQVINYTKGSKKYTIRDNAKSTGTTTADVYNNGELKKKIRLGND